MPHKALIIGGGISGLSAAYYLSKAGVHPTLIEKSPQLGGVIQTTRQHDCLIEAGPDSFIAMKPWAMDLIRELGYEPAGSGGRSLHGARRIHDLRRGAGGDRHEDRCSNRSPVSRSPASDDGSTV